MRCSAVWVSPLYLATSPLMVAISRLRLTMRAEAWSRWRCASLSAGSSVIMQLALQLVRLRHTLATDGPLAALQRAFDAAVLGGGLDALGGDGLPCLVVSRLAPSPAPPPARRSPASRRCSSASSSSRLRSSAVWLRSAPAMRSCCSPMPRRRSSILRDEVPLDLALRALRLLRQPGELRVVGLPAVGLEQALGLGELHLLRPLADVGDDAGRPGSACGSRRRASSARRGRWR